MLNIDNLVIEVTSGDTAVIDINLTGDDIPDAGTIALFTVEKACNTLTHLIEKRIELEGSTFTVDLSAQETDLPAGRYLWDLRFLYEDGTIYTPITPQIFRILPAVGDP